MGSSKKAARRARPAGGVLLDDSGGALLPQLGDEAVLLFGGTFQVESEH